MRGDVMLGIFQGNLRLVLLAGAGLAAGAWWLCLLALRAARRRRADVAESSRAGAAMVLRAPAGLLGMAIGVTLAGVTFAGLAALEGAWGLAAGVLGLMALPCMLWTISLLVRHELTGDGFFYDDMLGGRRHVSWKDVVSVRAGPDWFRVETRDGRVARIGFMLENVKLFARGAIGSCRPTAIGARAREHLQRAAEGRAWWGMWD